MKSSRAGMHRKSYRLTTIILAPSRGVKRADWRRLSLARSIGRFRAVRAHLVRA